MYCTLDYYMYYMYCTLGYYIYIDTLITDKEMTDRLHNDYGFSGLLYLRTGRFCIV
jgi:hypothetical protein